MKNAIRTNSAQTKAENLLLVITTPIILLMTKFNIFYELLFHGLLTIWFAKLTK